jgi:peptidoglycan/LPS O-acetylase OafA/YrhL
LKYRKEIDGLRAIAVLSVLLFHADVSGFSGGYVGVDVFFVISGYLITSTILEDLDNGSFSVVNFYERRARRILPALSLVLICTTAVAYILMPANLLKSYSQSLLSAISFSSNVFFYLTSGYFSTASDEKPLLHIWSLAVEEQFYLLFPVMIALVWPLGKKKVLSLILLLSGVSIIFSQHLSLRQAAEANFYLIFSRAWELLLGTVIALVRFQIRSPANSGAAQGTVSSLRSKAWFPLRVPAMTVLKRDLIGVVGLLMIVFSILYFDRFTPFPGFYALIPVLGTSMIIAFVDGDSLVGRFLSNRVFVSIGLVSYSLYLWHQPLFAFLRSKSIGTPSSYMFFGASIFASILAILSWKYVEIPFRNKSKITRRSIFLYSGVSIAVLLLIGLAGHISAGFGQRFNVTSYSESIKASPKRESCHTSGNDYLRPENACRYFGNNITWASLGDSHTVEPAYALAKELEADDIGLVHLSFSGCPPALMFEVRVPGCSAWINDSIRYLEKNEAIENVMLGFRYTAYLFGNQLYSYPDIPEQSPRTGFTDSYQQYTDQELRELYWAGFSEILSRLLMAGKNVYVLYPIPELPIHIEKAVSPFSVFGDRTILDLVRTTSSDYYFERNEYIINKLDSLPFGEKLHAIKPFELLCSSDFCPAVLNGEALYFDDNHLSVSGAELLAHDIINKSQISTEIAAKPAGSEQGTRLSESQLQSR